MRKGQPRIQQSREDRFWSYVVKADGCWSWGAFCDRDGYGKFRLGRKEGTAYAHRFMWQLVNGPIPPGMLVCHKCDNPPCTNPAHLFLGTTRDNVADKIAKGRDFSRGRGKTHCPRGHEYSEANTYRRGGSRNCRACHKIHMATYKARRAAQAH